MGQFIDYYEILGVDYAATREEVKDAYYRALKQYADDPSQKRLIKLAWATLGDSKERAQYDQLPQIVRKRRWKGGRKKGKNAVQKTQIISPAKTQIIRVPSESGSETVIHPISVTQYPLIEIHVDGPDGNRNLKFSQKSITIGRKTSSHCPDVCLIDENRYVSRKHARIEIDDEGIFIVDTSTNGTFVNDSKIDRDKRVQVYDGDEIRIEDWKLTLHLPQHGK